WVNTNRPEFMPGSVNQFQMRHIHFHLQDAHFMTVPKTHFSVNRTPVAGDNNNCLPHAAVWEKIFGGQLVFFSRSLADATVPGFAYGAAPCTGDRPLPPIFYDPCLAGNSRKQHPMGAFAVNRSIVTDAWWSTDPKTSLLSISRPSQKVIFCSIGPGDAQYCGGWLLTGADFVANGMSNNGYPDPRNAGGAASLFADGHVEKLDVAKMDQETRRRYFLPDPP
ncbi:MAG: hypothetical protein NTV93_15585, partial [Verrucomicrobia bacterium]|nr:hypothetical protein [Verrucomicrobiota bacterium]